MVIAIESEACISIFAMSSDKRRITKLNKFVDELMNNGEYIKEFM